MQAKMWVEIETTKGTQYLYTYRCQIDTEQFELWSTGQLTQGVLKLAHVYWTNDAAKSQNDPLYEGYGFSQTKFYDFTGTVYLKIEHIMAISTMNGLEAKQLFLQKEIDLTH